MTAPSSSLVGFVLAAILLAITPGVDTVMVVRTATLEGPRRAAFAAVGIALGCLVWGAAVALGLGALLAASEVAYAALRWAGAAYLAFLGVRMIAQPRGALDVGEAGAEAATDGARSGAIAWATRGLLTNLLNPKVGVFYVGFLPQFVPAGAPVAAYTFLLVAIHVAAGLVWFGALIAATAPLRSALRRPAVVRALDRVTGGLFVAFGVKLVLGR